ncbi:MAG: type I pullulanase [Coprobacillaceae bacterium]
MNYISSCMQANAIHLSLIEIQVSKAYYGGQIDTFYIREKNQKLCLLPIRRDREDAEYCYYQAEFTIDITKIYDILDSYGLTVVLEYQKLIHMVDFDTIFYYVGNDLGTCYKPNQTTWKVWAPTALDILVCIHQDNESHSYPMRKNISGVFSITLFGDYDGVKYTYLVNHNYSYVEVLDPYTYSSTSNAKESVVIDLNKCIQNTKKSTLKRMIKQTEAIIYEVSIRDFTQDIEFSNKGKYLGMVTTGLQTKEGNKAGIDYIKELGVTHVQIMPMYDFATVDENQPEVLYNWGYDPLQYGVPEGSYSSDVNNPYTRVIECQQMITTFHEHGIRVVMDVVYNHMYDTKQCAFENLVPGYFFRRNESGELSNGTWCGNDVNTSASMVRKYLVDMSKRWTEVYGIDGLRFDLMGIVDNKTLQEIHKASYQLDTNFIMYGEGWNMDTLLPIEEKGIQENHQQIPMIGFFNDIFRDKLKGLSDDSNLHDKGYFSGNMYNTEMLCQCLKNNSRYSHVSQSINYTECHDNATIFDKYSISNAEENEILRMRRQKLLTMVCILAQGIPFLHSGQEWYRTKNGITNSYNSNGDINKIDWERVDKYQEDILDIKHIIQIRKDNPGFWYINNEDVEKNIELEVFNHQMVKYTMHQEDGEYEKLIVYINGSNETHPVSINENYEVLYNDTNSTKIVEITPVSMVLLGIRK